MLIYETYVVVLHFRRIPTTSVPSTNPPTITSAQSTLSQQDVQTMFGHSNLPLVWAVEIKAMFHVAPTETYIISNNKHTTLKNACEGPEFRSEPRSMFSAFAAASQQMGNQPMAQSSHSLPASSVAQNIAASNVASAAAPPSRTMSGQVNLQQQQHPAVAMNLGSQSSLTSRGSGAPIGTHAHHQSGSQMSLGSQTSLTSQTSRGSGSSVAMQIQQQTSGQMGSGSVRSSQSSVRQSSTASAAGSLASVPTTCVAAWPWTVNPTTGTLRRQDPSKPVPAPYTYQAVPAPNAPAPQGSLGQGILMGQGSLGRSIDAENEAALG